jgi:predicted dehydrogenase
MDGEVGVGIVGCGHIAAAHVNALKELKEKGLLGNARVAALCDRNRARAESFVKRGSGPEQQPGVGPKGDPMQAPPIWVSDFQDGPPPVTCADYRELLARADVNAVLVLSSVFTHHEIGLAAIRARKNLLIEKPLAVSVKAARLLVDAAKRAGVTFGVAECVRYMPAARMARWAVDSGHLGAPQMSVFAAGAGYWAPDKIVGKTAWRHTKVLAAGGVAVDWMVHSFHQLRYVFGEIAEVAAMASIVEPVRTTRDAQGAVEETVEVEIDDTLSCSLRYANGAAGSVFVTWAGHGEELDLAPAFYGSRGSIRGDRITLDGQPAVALGDFFQSHAEASLKERLFPKGITNLFTLEMHDFL